MTRPALILAAALSAGSLPAQQDRWELSDDGGIRADLAKLTQGKDHSDHIEMAGRSVNAVIRWKLSADGRMDLDRWVRWPMLREKKDDTHAAANFAFRSAEEPGISVDGAEYPYGAASDFRIHGMLSWTERSDRISVRRIIFPSVHLPCLIERWEIQNHSQSPVDIQIPIIPKETTEPRENFLWSSHRIRTEWIGGGRHRLIPGETLVTGMVFSSRQENEPAPYPDLGAEWAARQAFISGLEQALVLQSGDPAVDRPFAFSKLRAAENVLATRGGLMHAPGGFNRYLAAIWCNDQNEYVSPFFPFLGDAAGNESARNAYKWFAKFMNPEFRHIPSSIVAEGRGIWGGAGDRGDAAMTAYGASRWALASGGETLAREVWPFIE